MSNIVLGVTGSIAAYKSADLANQLTKRGHAVQVVMTKNAREFVTPLTFETLTKRPVYTDSFVKVKEFDVEHIGLAKSADLLLIAPATANIIGKIAAGVADDLLTTVVMAIRKKPVVLCPAMNTAMYENPILQANLKTLMGIGYHFIDPRESVLACGDTGKGAMADNDLILQALEGFLTRGA